MFTVIGEYRKKKDVYRFSKKVSAKSKDEAVDKALSLIGSDHRVKRHLIKISEVKE